LMIRKAALWLQRSTRMLPYIASPSGKAPWIQKLYACCVVRKAKERCVRCFKGANELQKALGPLIAMLQDGLQRNNATSSVGHSKTKIRCFCTFVLRVDACFSEWVAFALLCPIDCATCRERQSPKVPPVTTW
jgi:hypothetical protein